MSEIESQAPFLVDANTPIMEGRDGYYQAFLILRSQLGRLISSEVTGITLSRTYYMTRLIVSGVTDEKERDRIIQKMEERKTHHKDLLQNGKGRSLSNEELARAEIEACFDVLGDISTWYDQFVGVTQKNLWNEV